MAQNSQVYRSFFAKDNDLACRSWIHKSLRYARSRVHLFSHGAKLLAEEPTVLRAWRRGWDAAHYVRLLRWREEGFRPQVIYDIGAYEGCWAEMCVALFPPKQIVLFEPQTELHERIRSMQVDSRTTVWKVLPVALGEKDRTELIHLTKTKAAASLLRPVRNDGLERCGTQVVGAVEVPIKRLDDVVATQNLPLPDLVKIDVQGFESKVLDGGEATLSQAARLVIEVSLREIYSGQALFFEVLQKVAAWGFVVQDITETLREWPAGELWQVDLWLTRGSG